MKSTRKKLLLVLLVILTNFFIVRFIRFQVAASNCISQSDWESMKNDSNHCYAIFSSNGKTEVFDAPLLKIGNLLTHKGNEICGTDVTNIIPASHTSDTAKYLSDTYRGELKATCSLPPTSTPVPLPTPTITKSIVLPLPTSTQTPTPTVISLLKYKTPSTTEELIVPTPPMDQPPQKAISNSQIVTLTILMDYIGFVVLFITILIVIIRFLQSKLRHPQSK